MFSFHKPKIYRSNLGCCICKAKSSSSRFTDSKKYENEFEQCFRLKEKRSGEICNACVLLVKRWKKLTPDNKPTKHWHHVVDARAGPGTKLTGNRRLTSPSSQSQRSNSAANSNDESPSKKSTNRCSDVLPLSSSNQANNQTATTNGSNRSRSLSKACAIDTNVSTFTFGEPIVSVNRTRSYMTSNESSYYTSNNTSYHNASPSSSLASSLSTKPQTGLSSSAFESVLKRFRQRQQQQNLEAQRRLMSRQQRVQQRLCQKKNDNQLNNSSPLSDGNADQRAAANQLSTTSISIEQAARRAQRYSSTENAFGVGSVLDSSIWRKEKICCGVVFRGLYNEIAIVPRLLKPCQFRLNLSGAQLGLVKDEEEDYTNNDVVENEEATLLNEEEEEEGEEEDEEEEDDDGAGDGEQINPPRATKSGSISSCDSNTSGCGSMEETINNSASSGSSSTKDSCRSRKSLTEPSKKRQRLNSIKRLDVGSPGGSSSGHSSTRLIHDGEDTDEQVVHNLIAGNMVLETSDATSSDSSNDATSSSVESLPSNGNETNAIAYG